MVIGSPKVEFRADDSRFWPRGDGRFDFCARPSCALGGNKEKPVMASKLANDPRIDPRIKAMFGAMNIEGGGDVASREELIAQEQTEERKTQLAGFTAMLDAFDNETVAPSAGLRISTETIGSEPDGNKINIR